MTAHEIHAGHIDHHEEHDDLHVTSGDYVKGFILAVILTVIPFWLVMGNVIQDRATAAMVLGIFAAVQVVVHMVYFLHMNGKLQGGWTMMSTIFAIVFVIITLAGTLWVMFHMNTNMMPHAHHQQAPAAVVAPVEQAAPAAAPAVEAAPAAAVEAPAAEQAAPEAQQPAAEAAPEAAPAAEHAHGSN